METSTYLYLILLIIPFLYYFAGNLINKKSQNLPPSPPRRLPVLGHLHLLKKPLHRTLSAISAKHGPTLLLYFGAWPVLLVSSPEVAEECFTKNDVVFANRPRFLAGKYLGYNYTTLAWVSYGQHWRTLRKIATLEILSSNRVQMFTEIRQQEVVSLIQRILKGSQSGPVEMKSGFFELTLNIMMRMIAGKRYYGDDDRNREEAVRFREMVKETFRVSGAMNMADFVPLVKWFGGQRKLENDLKKLQVQRDTFMQDLLDERRRIRKSCSNQEKNSYNKKTMIDVLLSLQEAEPEYYTDEIIKGLNQVMLSAGTDTSSGTMEWALAALLNNPSCLTKAQQEIDFNIGTSRLITDSDLAHLPYLHGVINETFRLYPVAPLLVPHVSSEDCTVAGYRVPRGALLLVNMWAMQNDPKTWEESTRFMPERFLNMEGQRDGFGFMPFGYGRRGCPGENMAMRVVGLTLGSLIQCFDWERVGEEMVDMTEGPGLTMPRAQPLFAKCLLRPQVAGLVSQL